MKLTYAAVFEKTPNNYCAYIPDLPGCVSVGRTWEEMQWMIKEAMELHTEGTHEGGDPVPMPRMSVEEALEFHRAQPNDSGGFFPELDNLEYPEDDEPYAVLEVEVEVNINLPAVPTPS